MLTGHTDCIYYRTDYIYYWTAVAMLAYLGRGWLDSGNNTGLINDMENLKCGVLMNSDSILKPWL